MHQSKQKRSVKSRSTRSEQKTGTKSKPSVQRKKKGDKIIKIGQKTETPKGVIQIQTNYQNSDSRCLRGKRHLRGIKPLPPPNLDDISPIVAHHVSQSKSPGKKVGSREKEPFDRRNLRSSPRTVETPSASFLKSSHVRNSNLKDDSGLFLSPRKTMPRFSEGKTSTPACVPKKTSHKVARKEHGRKCEMKVETSTPCEIKPLKSYTKLKKPLSELSPVQRTETPTSDYGSMVSYVSPSPTTAKKRKNRASSPAFTLEDDDTGELSVNTGVPLASNLQCHFYCSLVDFTKF